MIKCRRPVEIFSSDSDELQEFSVDADNRICEQKMKGRHARLHIHTGFAIVIISSLYLRLHSESDFGNH